MVVILSLLFSSFMSGLICFFYVSYFYFLLFLLNYYYYFFYIYFDFECLWRKRSWHQNSGSVSQMPVDGICTAYKCEPSLFLGIIQSFELPQVDLQLGLSYGKSLLLMLVPRAYEYLKNNPSRLSWLYIGIYSF